MSPYYKVQVPYCRVQRVPKIENCKKTSKNVEKRETVPPVNPFSAPGKMHDNFSLCPFRLEQKAFPMNTPGNASDRSWPGDGAVCLAAPARSGRARGPMPSRESIPAGTQASSSCRGQRNAPERKLTRAGTRKREGNPRLSLFKVFFTPIRPVVV